MKPRKWIFLISLIGFVGWMFINDISNSLNVFNELNGTKSERLVVIDPGHGGFDPGAVFGGIKESEINLQIAKKLKEYLEMFSFKVILTRYNSDDLSETDKKANDLKKRKDIVLKNNPEIFISVHLNSFPKDRYFGAQVFYEKSNQEGEKLAHFVQNELRYMPNGMFNKRQIKQIDVYILRNLSIPAILIECGFMSNKTELLLLQNPDYQEWLAQSILKGVLKYYQGKKEM